MAIQLLYIIATLILAILQVSVFKSIPVFEYLNPVLLFVIYASIMRKGMGIFLAVAGGYILDMHSSYPFGLHIFALMCESMIAEYAYFRILTNRRFFPILILLAAEIVLYHGIMLSSVFILSFLKLSPRIKIFSTKELKSVGIETGYTVLCSSGIYLLFRLLFGKKFLRWQ